MPAAWPASPAAGRLASYNLPMGPPIMAPGLMTIVGGMGLLAALLAPRGLDAMAGTCRARIISPTGGPDRQPPEPSWLPRQRRGTTPQMIGRYPDFDVFDAAEHVGCRDAPRWSRRASHRTGASGSSRLEEEPTLAGVL